MGNYFSQQIGNLKNNKKIKELRQYGLMIGIELQDTSKVMDIVSALRDKGILILTAGNNNQYIRLLPPLNVKKNELDLFFENFDKVLDLN